MTKDTGVSGASTSRNDAGIKRRGLLLFGSLVTAMTGASAVSAIAADSAAAAPGDKTSNNYIPTSEKAAPAGVATLDANAKIVHDQIPDLSATYVRAERFRSVTDTDLKIPLAKVIDGVSVLAGGTTLTKAGAFTPAMDGAYFYLERSGVQLVKGVNAWERGPTVGTMKYVNADSAILSVPPEVSVTAGRVLVGHDATASWNAALATCRFMRIPADTHLLLAAHVTLGDGQILAGDGSGSCSVRSVTPYESPMVTKRGAVNVSASGFSVWGSGFGAQPANVTPGGDAAPDLSKSGCGLVYINAQGGTIRDVIAFHCGGDMITAGHNGIAGIYLTMGCKSVTVDNCQAYYCRNGINEDSYFNPSNLEQYAAQYNTYSHTVTNYNVFGLGIDSGSLSRGCAVNNPVANYNVQFGIGVNASKQVTITNPRTAYNGVGFTNCGVQIYGTSSTVTAEHITVINPISFANGTHGLKVSEWAKNVKVFGGELSRNFRNGVYWANGADHGLILGTVLRNNGMGMESGGERDGLRITSCSEVKALVYAYDDQVTPTQLCGVREIGTSNDNTILDGSTFGPHAAAAVLLIGTRSRWGAHPATSAALTAQGFAGESISRLACGGTQIPASGDQRAAIVSLRKGQVISALHAQVVTAAAGLTLAKMGVWDANGALLASSVNTTRAFEMVGVASVGLTPFTVPADGAYFIGFLFVGPTPPALLRAGSGTGGWSGQAKAGALPVAQVRTGLTDVGPMMGASTSGTGWWVAWS